MLTFDHKVLFDHGKASNLSWVGLRLHGDLGLSIGRGLASPKGLRKVNNVFSQFMHFSRVMQID